MNNATPKPHLPDHPFLRFAHKLYEQLTVQNILGQLQQWKVQPNLLLYCCWVAQSGQGRLTKNDIQTLQAATMNWHERVVVPLKQTCDHLNRLTAADKFQELKTELQVEYQTAHQIEQLLLVELPISTTTSSKNQNQKLIDTCKNTLLYCKTLQLSLNTTYCDLIYQIIANVFPKIDLNETYQTCQQVFFEAPSEIISLQQKLSLD